MRPTKDRLLETVTFVVPGSDDVTFTHAVFAQCFLPLRKLPKVQKFYEVRHGRATLAIDAGRLLNPATQRFELMDVPAGSAARIALAHINNHLIRSRSLDEALTVPMGESLRDFMGYQGITVAGRSGKEIARQIHNVAAARITLGVWRRPCAADQYADRRDDRLLAREGSPPAHPLAADDARLAAVRRSDPRTLRTPRHAGPHWALREHAGDGHLRLARLPRVPPRHDLFIRYDDLKLVFGTGVSDPYKFRQLFKHSLRHALMWYRD